MSEKNKTVEETNLTKQYGETPAFVDTQLNMARELGMTWNFEGKEYALFVANGTGNISISVPLGNTGKSTILGARFMWEDSKDFIDHLNVREISENPENSDETLRRGDNFNIKNGQLFDALVQNGYKIKVDEDGEKSAPEEKDRAYMLNLPRNIKSELINEWLGNVYIERYFPKDVDEFESIYSAETVFFTVKIGNYHNPAHLLLIEEAMPEDDAISDFEDKKSIRSQKSENNALLNIAKPNNTYIRNFATKRFKNVQGAVMGEWNNLEPDSDKLTPYDKSNAEHEKQFRVAFNANWWIRLGRRVAEVKNLTGK